MVIYACMYKFRVVWQSADVFSREGSGPNINIVELSFIRRLIIVVLASILRSVPKSSEAHSPIYEEKDKLIFWPWLYALNRKFFSINTHLTFGRNSALLWHRKRDMVPTPVCNRINRELDFYGYRALERLIPMQKINDPSPMAHQSNENRNAIRPSLHRHDLFWTKGKLSQSDLRLVGLIQRLQVYFLLTFALKRHHCTFLAPAEYWQLVHRIAYQRKHDFLNSHCMKFR